MLCVSQSIACYKLLRCIISAAQFASGDLCFYENYAELVAQDEVGERTTPLRIDYDVLLHFRVVRQQQLMRIEVPRVHVWRWAEANGFASELDGGDMTGKDTNKTGSNLDKPCTLIEQLSVDDMTHFLQSVAPMIAASRRSRSSSRVSTTEPLSLSYFPPSPEAISALVAEKISCGTDGINYFGDNNKSSISSSDNNENNNNNNSNAKSDTGSGCEMDTAANESTHNSPHNGQSLSVTEDYQKTGNVLNDGVVNDAASRTTNNLNTVITTNTCTVVDGTSCFSSTVSVLGQRDKVEEKENEEEEEKKKEEECLSRCLEALDAAEDVSNVHLARGMSTQNSAFFECVTGAHKKKGIRQKKKEEKATESKKKTEGGWYNSYAPMLASNPLQPPKPQQPPSSLLSLSPLNSPSKSTGMFLRRKDKPTSDQQSHCGTVQRRRAPHVSSDANIHGVSCKRTKTEGTPPQLSPAAAAYGILEDTEAAKETKETLLPQLSVDIRSSCMPEVSGDGFCATAEKEIPASSGASCAILTRANAAPANKSTVTRTIPPGAKAKTAEKFDAVTSGVAYNFADFMTAPEDAAELPLVPAVKKLLVDLQEILPSGGKNTRRCGGGRKKDKRPAAKRTTSAVGRGRRRRRSGEVEKNDGAVAGSRAGAGETTTQPPPEEISATTAVPTTGERSKTKEVSFLSHPTVVAVDEKKPLLLLQLADHTVPAQNCDPSILSFKRQLSDDSSVGATDRMAILSSHNIQLANESRLPANHLNNVSKATVVSAPSSSMTPRSDYNFAQNVHNRHGFCTNSTNNNNTNNTNGSNNINNCVNDGGDDNDSNVGAALGCESFAHAAAAENGNEDVKKPGMQVQSGVLSVKSKENQSRQTPTIAGFNNLPLQSKCRKNRWRSVMRNLNSLSLHLTQARACGEELRGLFLMMLEDAEI